MTIPFIHRSPTKKELERFRLILSPYQDGSGQQAVKGGLTLPGWRDFERSVALAFNGIAQESKFIFDVLLPDPKRKGVYFGLSCKMRRTLNDTKRTGRVTLELSNSSGAFWEQLRQISIHQQNYQDRPFDVARALLKQEYEWHKRVGLDREGMIDLSRSFYLALSWNTKGEYQLFRFALDLPDPLHLTWDFPVIEINSVVKQARRLRGQDENGTLFEWYGESGGQLKYYPLVEHALWKSEIFHLEPLLADWNEKHGILVKARDYFPGLWRD